MSEALFDHANASAGFAEQEASDLRDELRRMQEHHIVMAHLHLRRERVLLGLYQRLFKFRQISRAEIHHQMICNAEDAKSIRTQIANYRARWGAHPMCNGKPVEL